jgi:hypothetical protein
MGGEKCLTNLKCIEFLKTSSTFSPFRQNLRGVFKNGFWSLYSTSVPQTPSQTILPPRAAVVTNKFHAFWLHGYPNHIAAPCGRCDRYLSDSVTVRSTQTILPPRAAVVTGFYEVKQGIRYPNYIAAPCGRCLKILKLSLEVLERGRVYDMSSNIKARC